MSPIGKGLLASALTLPLVAFVAGVLAAPDAVDPDRSRPVFIGKVNDEEPTHRSTRERSRETPPGGGDQAPGPEDEPDEDPEDDIPDDQPYTVVTPPPRDLDDDEDGGDDDDDDDTDERGGDD